MDTYLTAWKTFRRLSNENAATADHLVHQLGWPSTPGRKLADIGCGDGELLSALLSVDGNNIETALLIDPDLPLLSDAERMLRPNGQLRELRALPLGIAETVPSLCADADVILLVHVAYLLRDGELERALALLPRNIPLFLVLDSPDSVFTTLWQRTAVKYHARAMAAHGSIRDLPHTEYDVQLSTIASTIRNPLDSPNADVRDALLSILTYSSIDSQTPTDLRKWVEQTIGSRVVNGSVQCSSTCYNIRRR